MKLLIISILLCLMSNVAIACESYEECLEKAKYNKTAPYYEVHETETTKKYNHPGWGFIGQKETGEIGYRQEETLRAIAYKLDEISKKLGPDPEKLAKVIDLVHKEGGKVNGFDE